MRLGANNKKEFYSSKKSYGNKTKSEITDLETGFYSSKKSYGNKT